MDKQTFISHKIAKLIAEGRPREQAIAIAISMSEKKYQEGGALTAEQEKASIAPQRKIFKIQPVTTQGYKDNNQLPPGNYFKVFYTDPNKAKTENEDFEYIDSSGYKGMQNMNNFKIYMESLKQPYSENGLAIKQQGGSFYDNYNLFFSQAQQNYPPNEGIAIDPTNMTQEGYNPSMEMENRMAQNRVTNSYTNPSTGEDNYDENGNPINTNLQYDDYVRYNLINPFGGSFGLDQSLAYAGKSFGEGKTGQGVMGAGLSLFKGARNFLGAYGAGKQNKQLEESVKNKLYNTKPNYTSLEEGGKVILKYLQKGGEVTNADLLTGQFITDSNNPSVEIENAEHVKDGEDGMVRKAVGETHEQGGIKTSLPSGSKVLSDFTKIGATNAKSFSDKYGIKAKATDTFAKVMDKVNKKIGVTDLIEEEKEYFKKVDKTLKIEDENTKELNMEFLSKEVKEVQDKKLELQSEQSKIFEDIFEAQESIPKRGDGTEILKDGGKKCEEGGMIISDEVRQLAKQYNISEERLAELMKMQEGGIQNQQEEVIEGSQSNTQEEQKEITQEQIIQAYAQATQQDPQAIIEQLQAISPEEQQNALQQMLDSLQQGGEEQQPMMQEGGKLTDAQKRERFNEFYKQAVTLGYEGDADPNAKDLNKEAGKLQKFMVEKHPTTVTEYAKQAKLTAKGVSYLQKNNPELFKQAGVPVNKPSTGYTEEELKKVSELAQKENRVPDTFWNEQFQDNKWDYRFPLVSPSTLSTPKIETPKINAPLPNIQQLQTPVTPTEDTLPTQEDATVVQRNLTKNIIPDLFTPFRTTPSSVTNPYLQQVNLGRKEAQKGSVENSLVANSSAMQTAYEQTKDLPPALRASMLANLLGQEQQANTQAITTQELADIASEDATATFNIGQSGKEQLLNEGLKKQYETEAFATMNNSENAWNKYYNAVEGDRRQNFEDIRDLNLTNATMDNYQTTGSSVDFVNPTKFTVNQPDKYLNSLFSNAKTPEERNKLQQMLIESWTKNQKP